MSVDFWWALSINVAKGGLEDLVFIETQGTFLSASKLEGLSRNEEDVRGLMSPSERSQTRVRVRLALDPEIRGFMMPQLDCRTHGPWVRGLLGVGPWGLL
ncbi:hypothetical protein F2Q69_00059018 [Brassica cretica]|uniref:Uncharacterized protein n=1 Tax=Brassica cretica TaxID=69181 RepID=A0A8S9REC7_BRACR|nr:hypothetical protein F2Q69_00059018 [Brassica cretica]